jgi:hypothetical protein
MTIMKRPFSPPVGAFCAWLFLCAWATPFITNGQTPPSNDVFADAYHLTGNEGSFGGSNVSATSEPGEPVHELGNAASIWWRWTAPATGDFMFCTEASFGMTVHATVFVGTSVLSLTQVVWPTISSILGPSGGGTWTPLVFRAVEGMTYYFRFSSGRSSATEPFGEDGLIAGWYSFRQINNIPVNDNFAGRLPLSGLSNVVAADISLASLEINEPRSAECNPAGRTLWWTYVAPSKGTLRVSASGAAVWSVYRGDALEQLELVGRSCQFPMDTPVKAGEELVVSLDGVSGSTAYSLELHTIFSTTPENDNFADSARLEGTAVTFIGSVLAASLEPGEPASPAGLTNTTWASWTAPLAGRARYTFDCAPPASVAVYTGSTVDALQPVWTAAASAVAHDFIAVQGGVYHFQMTGSGDSGTLRIELPAWPQITNDFFASAQVLAGQSVGCASLPLVEATAEPGEPAHLEGVPFKSLWWKWVAPVSGSITLWKSSSLATNLTLAAYTGESLSSLSLVGKRQGDLLFWVEGGETYYIAAAVPADAIADVTFHGSVWRSTVSRIIPGNLLLDPSWEETYTMGGDYWGSSETGVGGGTGNACDGVAWLTMSGDAQVWQDVSTVPGRSYKIKFAICARTAYVGTGAGDARVRVLWDGKEIGVGVAPEAEVGFWHWPEFTVVAQGSSSRVTFMNAGRNVELDAFSVVDTEDAPRIVAPPVSATVLVGGTASFVVNASGSQPLTYWWYYNGNPFMELSSSTLILKNVSLSQAGSYHVVVSNAYGTALSEPVTLSVQSSDQPVILWQPYGDTAAVGGYHNFAVTASGALPLGYQWFKDGAEIAGATNRTLTFGSIDYKDAGTYNVRVTNQVGIAWSLGATLTVNSGVDGGGVVFMRNRATTMAVDAPIYDLDGVTRLSDSNYLAQLYAGPSLETLRPVGLPCIFRTKILAGYYTERIVKVPTVLPRNPAVVQVRAWDATVGSSYEEARALGGRFGKSGILEVILAEEGPMFPPDLVGLQSFNLQAGLPAFTVGEISFVERQPNGEVLWSHRGQPGTRYVIEKSVHGFEWKPYLIITNLTSTVTFSDSADSGSSVVFYRSRILD